MKKPAGTITLSSEEGEVLIAQVHQSNLPAAVAGRVTQIIRMYFWVVFALQEAKLSVKRLRNLLFGSRAQPKDRPASEVEATSSEAPGQAAGAEEAALVDEVAPRLETTGCEAGSGASESEAKPKPKGGHRAGTGRLGADAYVGAERTECRHEDLAVGQRCPVCGQGTLYELPPGVEIRIDGQALLSALRYELQKLRCSACGQIFTASLPHEAGEEKYSPRARAVLVVGRYYLGLPLYRIDGYQAMLGVPITFRGRIIGVLYAANRSAGEIGDRAQTLAMEFAASLGPALGAAMHARRAARLSALEERQRISRDLHDNLSPLLFGIGTAVRRTSEALPDGAENLLSDLRCIEARAAQAATSLRDILRALAPANSEEGLPAVIRMDVSSFAAYTGLAADLAVIGEPYDLSGEQESVLVSVVREGLHNVAKHAQASSVVVTLHYGLDTADVLIQDDGTGLPEGFAVTEVPRDGTHYGLASLTQRLARLGGEIELSRNEDAGMTLHASLPTGAG